MGTHGYPQISINLQEKSKADTRADMEQGIGVGIYSQGGGRGAIPPPPFAPRPVDISNVDMRF